MDDALLTLLRKVDMPTVCNAIEVVQGLRGHAGFTRGTAIVGHAVTAQIAALDPPVEPQGVIRARRIDHYRAMHDAAKPWVAVIEDLDWPHCIGACWGEVNATIHKGFGMSGAVTNGVVRDPGDLPVGFPVSAGSIGPSHGFVHVRSRGTPVRVFGLVVAQGDLIHADRHGAVVIPPDVVAGLGTAIAKLQQTERLILDPARGGDFDFAVFEAAWYAFERTRT
jgi:regulator of RNase E activity RraA